MHYLALLHGVKDEKKGNVNILIIFAYNGNSLRYSRCICEVVNIKTGKLLDCDLFLCSQTTVLYGKWWIIMFILFIQDFESM